MMDQFLQEQHTYHIQRAQGQRRPSQQGTNRSDQRASWVMLRDNGDIVRLRGETIRHKAPKISFEVSVPKSLQSGRPPFSIKSDSGTVYITTYRVRCFPLMSSLEIAC